MHKSEQAYRREQVLETSLHGIPIHLVTRAGFADWGHISQAMQLLAAHAEIAQGERVLICPCGHGALGVWAATRTAQDHLYLLDTNIVAVEMARRTLTAHQLGGVQIEAGLPAPAIQPCDVALMILPKGRDLWRLWLLQACSVLRAGGRLYLAGPNDGGVKSAIDDGEALLGPAAVLAYRGGNRVVRLRKGETCPDPLPEIYRTPGLANGTYLEFEIGLRGETYRVHTRPGVFSWRSLDAGTRLLLETLEVRVTDTVLDVGCGYGIIGMVAATRALKGQVTMVDVDLLACECARENLALNGIQRAEVLLGDGLAAVAGRRFSLVVSNPPFHTGRESSSEMAEAFIQEAHAALEPRGRLVLVAHRFLPLDRLMSAVFGSATRLAETPQYHVLAAEKAYQRKVRGKQRRTALLGSTEETLYQIPD